MPTSHIKHGLERIQAASNLPSLTDSCISLCSQWPSPTWHIAYKGWTQWMDTLCTMPQCFFTPCHCCSRHRIGQLRGVAAEMSRSHVLTEWLVVIASICSTWLNGAVDKVLDLQSVGCEFKSPPPFSFTLHFESTYMYTITHVFVSSQLAHFEKSVIYCRQSEDLTHSGKVRAWHTLANVCEKIKYENWVTHNQVGASGIRVI